MPISKVLAAASAANAAAGDMIEAARDGEITRMSNVGSGETVTALADALRLLIDGTDGQGDTDTNQLHGALVRFLEERA
ncbi:hypothetical protein [Marinovum algicola]|uniref:hypothetical protein n=1 Tax=Marinovum algicola TaxID=42444 RepID=UPI003B525A32